MNIYFLSFSFDHFSKIASTKSVLKTVKDVGKASEIQFSEDTVFEKNLPLLKTDFDILQI